MANISYFIKNAFVNMRRNLGTTIGGVLTLFLALVLISSTIIMSGVVDNVAKTFEEEVNIRLYVSDDAQEDQISSMNSYLDSMKSNNIASYTLKSKDEVLADFTVQTKDNPDMTNQLDGNPLPRTYVIELNDTSKVAQTASDIGSSSEFAAIADNREAPMQSVKYGEGTVDKIFAVTSVMRTASIIIIVVLALISVIFLINTIRLGITARKSEISIMRLIGASNGFISSPFFLEGVFQAIIASAMSAIVLILLQMFALPILQESVAFLPITPDTGSIAFACVIMLLFSLLVGTLGAGIAIRKYLKV